MKIHFMILECKLHNVKIPTDRIRPILMKHIPSDRLYVSEPNPMYFGNEKNPRNNANWTNENWLKSRFHFAFAEYRSYENSNFGVLRVMNDDLVQPARGFGTHGHRDQEIVTYVVRGEVNTFSSIVDKIVDSKSLEMKVDQDGAS